MRGAGHPYAHTHKHAQTHVNLSWLSCCTTGQTNKQNKQTNKQTRKFVGTARMSWRKAGRVFSFSTKCFQTHFSCYTELHPQQWSLLGGPSWCAAIPAIAKPTKCWCLCCLNFNYLTYPPTMTCVKPIESFFPCICSNLCSLKVHGVALVDVTEGYIYIYIYIYKYIDTFNIIQLHQ